MRFKTRAIIKDLEEHITNSYSLPIFQGYKAVNKSGVVKLIDELYTYLPDDVKRARDFLKNRDYDLNTLVKNNSNIYDLLQKFEVYLEKSSFMLPFFIPQIVIIKVNEIEEFLNRIEKDLPTEIQKAENLDK